MEFLNSFFKSVNERLTSPLYGALLIATIIWNYDIFLTIFFVDNEAILKITGDKLMKATYIHDVLFPTVFGRNLLDCMHPLLAYGLSIVWRIMPVFGLTWLFIEKIPELANWAHGKERNFMLQREKGNIQYDIEVTKEKTKLLNEEKKKIDAEVGKVTSEKKKRTAVRKLVSTMDGIISPQYRSEQEIWDEDFKILISKYPQLLTELSRLIFENKGYISSQYGYNNDQYIEIFEVNDLIGKRADNRSYYDLKEKGKYFLKKQTLK